MSRSIIATGLTALAAALLLSACAAPPAYADSEKVQLCATIYPLSCFASQIGGTRVEVHDLVVAGEEPHDWEPSPSHIILLERSRLLIYNGAGLEHWIDAVLPTIKSGALRAVDTSAGLALLEEDGRGYTDPHVWLSPRNAKEQARAIKDALIEVDPEGKSFYEENYSALCVELDNLDREYADTIASLPGRDIVVAHAAFGYLCRDYGLLQVAVQGFYPDSEPDPAGMAQAIRYARNNNVRVIFFESKTSDEVAGVIASEIGADTDVLNPLEALSEADIASGKDYFSVMRQNLEALEKALG